MATPCHTFRNVPRSAAKDYAQVQRLIIHILCDAGERGTESEERQAWALLLMLDRLLLSAPHVMRGGKGRNRGAQRDRLVHARLVSLYRGNLGGLQRDLAEYQDNLLTSYSKRAAKGGRLPDSARAWSRRECLRQAGLGQYRRA